MKTRFIDNQALDYDTMEKCHDGDGMLYIKDIIGAAPSLEKEKGFLKFLHDDVIPPHTTVGIHTHEGEPQEEWYYCMEGEGIMVLDGKEYPMHPGDISVCHTDGSHAIRNESSKNLRILVIYASMPNA